MRLLKVFLLKKTRHAESCAADLGHTRRIFINCCAYTSVRRKVVLTNMAAKAGAVCVLKNHFLLFGFGLVWGIFPPGNSITPESLSQALLAI